MVQHCCYGHSNSSKTDCKVTFLTFPKPGTDLKRAQRWAFLCGRGSDFTAENITKDTYIFSLHFNVGPGESLDWKKNPLLEPISARSSTRTKRRRILNREQANRESLGSDDLTVKKDPVHVTYGRKRNARSMLVNVPEKPMMPMT